MTIKSNISKKVFCTVLFSIFSLLNSNHVIAQQDIPTYDTFDPYLGLVAYYPFNGNANDESGNGNNGIVFGATLTSDRWGHQNQAYYFNGIDSYIQVMNSSSLSFGTGPITAAAWAKPLKVSGIGPDSYGYSIIGTNWGPNLAIELRFRESKVDWIARGSVGNYGSLTSSTEILVGQWYHIVAVRNPATGKLRLYINGTFDSEANDNPLDNLTTTVDWAIGGMIGTAGIDDILGLLDGSLDNIRLYNRALNDDEVKKLYDLENGLEYRLPFVGLKEIINGPGCGKGNKQHKDFTAEAIDYAMVIGTPVYATEAGVVSFVGTVPNKDSKDLFGFGLYVKIEHSDGSCSYYAHLSNAVVAPGLNVTKGQLIGYSGDSGKAKGHPHLHFQIDYADGTHVNIRTLPDTVWYSGDPNNPCQKSNKPDGYAIGPQL